MTTKTFRSLALAGATVLAAAGASLAVVDAVGPKSNTTTVVRPVAVPQNTAAKSSGLTVNQIYRNASPGVVELTVTSNSSGSGSNGFPFGGGGSSGQKQQAQGSGWVYDMKGDIVTDQHVVDGATAITVRFADGSTTKGTLVGSDASTDLAVIHVNVSPSKLHPLAVANSDDVAGRRRRGRDRQPVRAPEHGHVGHHQRPAPPADGAERLHDRQLDPDRRRDQPRQLRRRAARHAGPRDRRHVADRERRRGGNEGVGFAVPSNTVKTVVTKLVSSGKISHAYLGISAADASSPLGAKVETVVSGTAADKAGLQQGDVVTAVNGSPVTSAAELTQAIDGKTPGQQVTLTVSRNGSTRTIHATLGTRPNTAPTG